MTSDDERLPDGLRALLLARTSWGRWVRVRSACVGLVAGLGSAGMAWAALSPPLHLAGVARALWLAWAGSAALALGAWMEERAALLRWRALERAQGRGLRC